MIFCLSSCQKDDPIVNGQEEQNEEIEENEDTEISDITAIEDFEIGDCFFFSYLKGDSYHDDENFDFNYTADTLSLLVTDFVDQKFILQEKILASSTIFQTNGTYLKKDSVYTHQWYIENDSLKIYSDVEDSKGSHMFSFRQTNEIGFPLSEFVDEEINMQGWKTEYSYVGYNNDFYTSDFELFDNSYSRLNVMIRNTGMLGDADGWTYLYNKEDGFVRVISYSAWTAEGWGWDRI